MFKYYQTGEKSYWKIINDEGDTLSKVLEQGGRKMTILSVSQEITEETKHEEIKYKGPFYADIDVKGDLTEAAKSAKTLIEKLTARDVPEDLIQLYASGSKGFHIIISEKVFSSGRPLKSLPAVYKEMALAMYVRGLDLQVYCGGKGNSWRIENLKREDGNYRVRISTEELDKVIEDAEFYKELVSTPRIMTAVPEVEKKSTGFEALFAHSKVVAGRTPSQKAVIEAEGLTKAFAEELPQCVVDLREGRLRKSVNFNQVALNMAVFSARSGRSEGEFQSLSQRMAEKTDSSTYDTERKREEHCEGVYKYVASSSKYQFSCAGMRSCVNTSPCDECPINDSSGAEAASEGIGIAMNDSCYYRVAASGGSTLITTFTITPKHKIMGPSDDDVRIEVMKGIMCDVLMSNGRMTQRLFTEGSWKSKSAFLSAIEGIEGATFFGSDTDIQKLKFHVFSEENQMDEVREVIQAGIRIDDFKGYPLPVYVEPGMSVNKFGTQGTHIINRDVPLPPHMKDIMMGDVPLLKAAECLELICRINKPDVMGLLLGWFSACHIKSHLFHKYQQFPLINLWGNAGSGKTRTAEMLIWLSGVATDYSSLSLSLPHATKFPVINYTTSTTTVPRILEEFNKSKLSHRDYNNIHEILKSAYNHHPVSRGAIGGGNQTSSLPNAKAIFLEVTSPLLYVSEQPIESPPLRQRSMAIGMDAVGRKMGSEAWFELQGKHKSLEVVAKLLCLEALATTVLEVQEMMEAQALDLPDMEERPRYNLQVCKVGLEYLRKVVVKSGMPASTVAAVDLLIEGVEDNFEDIVRDTMDQTSRTEVDRVLDDMALMAYLESTSTAEGIKKGVHYFLEDGRLFLDLPVAHALYIRSKKSNEVVIETYSQMVKLLRNEEYFLSDRSSAQELGINRKVVELDLQKMVSKGIETSLFE